MPETNVKYKGAKPSHGPSDSVAVDGVEFPLNVKVSLDNEKHKDLIKELQEGSDRLAPFKFEVDKPKSNQSPKGR